MSRAMPGPMGVRVLPVLLALVTGLASRPAHAQGPDPPALVAPAQDEHRATTNPTLEVTVSGPAAAPLTVRFFGRPWTGPDFTIVPIPDTQYYTSMGFGGLPAMLHSQMDWIVASRAERNIVYAVQTGDCTDHGQNGGDPVEWIRADQAFSKLEDPMSTGLPEGIPYGICVGNHDQTPGNDPEGSTEFYNLFFGEARFQGRSYYGGHYGNNNDQWWQTFRAGGMEFLVVSTEYDTLPNPDVLRWADSLVAAHPGKRVIVASHNLIGDGHPGHYGRQGLATWLALRRHPGLFLMLNSHSYGEGRRRDVFEGNTVDVLMADYQHRVNGGEGWLRILEFSPRQNVIRVRTYSPWLNQWEADADSSSQFTLDYDMTPSTVFQELGARTGVASGGRVQLPWENLENFRDYEWYVTVSDGVTTTAGPTWRFRTTDTTPPVARVLSPAEGEVLTVGQPVVVRWAAFDDAGVWRVELQLSRNGAGGPWEPLATGLVNTGTHDWRVGGPLSDRAFLKVVARDVSGNAGESLVAGPLLIGRGATVPVAAPNPARGTARLIFDLASTTALEVEILDLQGRRVSRVAKGTFGPGRHQVFWSGGRPRAPAGIYLTRIVAGGRSHTGRFLYFPGE